MFDVLYVHVRRQMKCKGWKKKGERGNGKKRGPRAKKGGQREKNGVSSREEVEVLKRVKPREEEEGALKENRIHLKVNSNSVASFTGASVMPRGLQEVEGCAEVFGPKWTLELLHTSYAETLLGSHNTGTPMSHIWHNRKCYVRLKLTKD